LDGVFDFSEVIASADGVFSGIVDVAFVNGEGDFQILVDLNAGNKIKRDLINHI
jgi:hypothetical protein